MSESEQSSLPGKKGDQDALVPAPTNLQDMLRELAPEALKSISPGNLEKLKGAEAVLIKSERHTRTEFSMTHSGPLPPPSHLAQYNEIIPQGADRLMKQAESQSAHRIEIEKAVVGSQGKRESNGQWFAFIITIVAFACGTYVITLGHDWAGSTIICGPLVGIVSAFVYSKVQGASERKEKKLQMDAVNPSRQLPDPANPNHSNRKQRQKSRK